MLQGWMDRKWIFTGNLITLMGWNTSRPKRWGFWAIRTGLWVLFEIKIWTREKKKKQGIILWGGCKETHLSLFHTCSVALLAWTSRSAAEHNECNFHKRLGKRSACLHSWLTVKQHESIWQTVLDVDALLFVTGQRNWCLLSLKGKTIH